MFLLIEKAEGRIRAGGRLEGVHPRSGCHEGGMTVRTASNATSCPGAAATGFPCEDSRFRVIIQFSAEIVSGKH